MERSMSKVGWLIGISLAMLTITTLIVCHLAIVNAVESAHNERERALMLQKLDDLLSSATNDLKIRQEMSDRDVAELTKKVDSMTVKVQQLEEIKQLDAKKVESK